MTHRLQQYQVHISPTDVWYILSHITYAVIHTLNDCVMRVRACVLCVFPISSFTCLQIVGSDVAKNGNMMKDRVINVEAYSCWHIVGWQAYTCNNNI